MKLLSSFLPFAFCSRDPNFKYNKRVVEGLTGTDCEVSALTVAKFEADIKCAEGDFIPEETMCTLQCTSQGTAPVFAELLCRKGELHPPGFLMNYFWSDWDMENGLKISCEVPDEVPEPGVKRGMAIWNSGQQAEFVKTYNLPSKHPSNFTIGSISFWSLNHNWWAFQNEGDDELLVEENHVWPIMAYPRCTQETDSRYGDGSCDQDNCASVPWGTNTCTHPKFSLPRNNEVIKTGEKWMGYLNEPYGDSQANITVQNAKTLWPSFWDRVEEHAQNHGVSTDEIKIVGPSIASKDSAMRWGEDFYLNLPENIRIDAINVHEYNINGGQQGVNCNCEPKLLRDTLSHYRAKFGLPVWLVEFNCGNGWWDCPNEQHHEYMKETLPMLEEMPWVVRYNWMAALTETQFGALNSNVAPFPLTELGETYNQFVWDRVNTHNPQWGDNAGGTDESP